MECWKTGRLEGWKTGGLEGWKTGRPACDGIRWPAGGQALNLRPASKRPRAEPFGHEWFAGHRIAAS
ncbi:MAG: hypothetical protein ACOYOU_10835 [Kiritimatiellia bacterium]